MTGRIYFLRRRGRNQEAYDVCIRLFELLATVPAEYHHHPTYLAVYTSGAKELDDLCILLKRPSPCAQLRAALRMLTMQSHRSNALLAARANEIRRRIEAGCGKASARDDEGPN
jgi:hypothetical protein